MSSSELARQRAVSRRHRLGAPGESLKRIARVAASIFGTESGLVAFVGADRQLNIACAGHVPENVSLEVSFCARTIRSGSPLVVEDASQDERFAQNPLVQEAGGLRFYVGAPIQASTGELLGTVSAFGSTAQTVHPPHMDRLRDLAALAADLLDRYLRERQYETALEDPGTHLCVLDPDGVLVDIGSAALERAGTSREDVIDQPVWNTPWVPQTEASQRLVRQQIRRVVDAKVPVPFQTEYTGPEGDRLVRGSVRPVVGMSGAVASLVVVGRDVTNPTQEVKAVREKLEKTQDSLERRATLLGAMGHEVRTPLTSILAATEVLRAMTSENGTDHASEASLPPSHASGELAPFLDAIERSGNRLLSAVNGVLELSRLDAAEMDLVAQTTDLRSHAEEVPNTFRSQATDVGVTLHVEAEESVPAQAHTEGVQLILRNLISNAIKYTESGGDVWIRAFMESSDTGKPSSESAWAVLQVEDSGIGMSPNEAEKMFDAFYRSGRAPERGADGTGLGLALVQQVVRQMNGTVTLDTAEGMGTTLTVRLKSALESAQT